MIDAKTIKLSENELKPFGIRYISDSKPGFRRIRKGRGFQYLDPAGNVITDEVVLNRIKNLVIPPAWEKVWISPDRRGHLQAVGYDKKGRKQYLYHPEWNVLRNEKKYSRLLEFSKALPKIRKKIESDLKKKELPREKVLAIVVKLIEFTRIRIGNKEYTRLNQSYGLTTLRNKHVTIKGKHVIFKFRGKSGKEHEVDVESPRLARLVKRCREIPGYELFQYFDQDGNKQVVDSGDVNDYLKEISGKEFTSKDYRTWGGTVLALKHLHAMGPANSQTELKKNIVSVIKEVAGNLNNTTAICRKYYIHPTVFDAYETGLLFEIMKKARPDRNETGLDKEEKALTLILNSKN
jgi:DNA topoisomerase I